MFSIFKHICSITFREKKLHHTTTEESSFVVWVEALEQPLSPKMLLLSGLTVVTFCRQKMNSIATGFWWNKAKLGYVLTRSFLKWNFSYLLLYYHLILLHAVISLLSRKVPTITQWLKEVLKDDEVVAADPTLIGTTTWQSNEKELGIYLDPIWFSY